MSACLFACLLSVHGSSSGSAARTVRCSSVILANEKKTENSN